MYNPTTKNKLVCTLRSFPGVMKEDTTIRTAYVPSLAFIASCRTRRLEVRVKASVRHKERRKRRRWRQLQPEDGVFWAPALQPQRTLSLSDDVMYLEPAERQHSTSTRRARGVVGAADRQQYICCTVHGRIASPCKNGRSNMVIIMPCLNSNHKRTR